MNNISVTMNKEKALNYFLGLVVALVIALIPWGSFREAGYVDRDNYTKYIDLYLNKVHWFDFSDFITKISYEWGWHYTLDYMHSTLKLDSGTIFLLISIFFLGTCFCLISSKKKFYLGLLLINPLFVNFFYSQIRLSLAIPFIFISLMTFKKNKFFSILVLIPSLFIHTSAPLFIFIFYSAFLLSEVFSVSERVKFIVALLVGLIAAFVTGPYMSVILGSIEDRRAEYSDMSAPTLYMIFWIGLFFLFMLKFVYNKLNNVNHYYFYISVSILTMVIVNVFVTGYASRFVAASFPFLILALSDLKGKNEIFAIVLYFFFNIIMWVFWAT